MKLEIIEKVYCPATHGEELLEDCQRCEHHSFIDFRWNCVICRYDADTAEKEASRERDISKAEGER